MSHGDQPSEEIVIYSDKGSDIDLGTSVWGYISIDPKDKYHRDVSALYAVGGVVFTTAGIIFPPLGIELAVAGALVTITSIILNNMATDPPQQDYKGPVRVNRLDVHLLDRAGPKKELVGVEPLLETLNDIIPLTSGLMDALERFQGSQNGGDSSWAARHAHGARLLLACATTRHLQLSSWLESYCNAKVDALEMNQTSYDIVKKKAQAHDLLPNEATNALLHGGIRKEELSAFEEMVAEYPMNKLPVGTFKDLTSKISHQIRTEAIKLVE